MIGDRIGRYVVLDTLGSGGMGLVVRAHDPELDRAVAIKVVRPRRLSPERSEAARARLLAEARALARISHPNVVSVFEVGVHEGLVYVAMELVDGVDLEHWLEQPRSVREIVEVFAAVARGLAQVHAVGLVHRDVKPANILLAADGSVKIGDFGIAHASVEPPRPVVDGVDGIDDPDATALTTDGRVVGTPAYMAPEQHRGLDVGTAADQYALCVSLFEALFGVRPFHVDQRRLLPAKLAGPRLPPRSRAPSWLAVIVRRGLAPEPSDRFASMADLASALARDPSRTRRRALGFVAAGTIAVGLVAIAAADARSAPCVRAEESGAWDPATRAAVEAAFAASERPWADRAWAQASARLDRYAADWAAMRGDACEAASVRGEQNEAVLDRRMACLDARRRDLAAVSDMLATGSDDAIDHTADLLARLRPIAPCGDAAAVMAAIPPPDDPNLVAPVEAVRADLAHARALVDAGNHPEALALARAAVREATALEHRPVLAEALALEGEALLEVGPIADARSVSEDALWLAIEIGHDEVAAAAATNLVLVAGQYERSLPDALRWAELARASLERGGGDPLALASLENAVGWAQQHVAHYDDAMATFERALARIADDPNAVSGAASLRHSIAKSWFDRGDLEKAREVLEPAIAELAHALGGDHPRVVEMRGTLAKIFGAAGDHARAVELFTEEIEGLRLAMGDDALPVAHARSNLGVALGRVGRADEAIAVTELALASFERAGDDGGAATCLANIADDLLQQRIHDAAAVRFARALALLEAMYPGGHPDLLQPLVGLGRVELARGRFEDALASFVRADEMLARMEGSGHWRGIALEGKAQALVMLRRNDDAILALDEQVAVVRRAGDVGPEELPLALRQRAEFLNDLGRFDAALADADEGIEIAREHGLGRELAACEDERARALEGLARAR